VLSQCFKLPERKEKPYLVVIIGGIERIGQFSEKLVPIMSILYILGGISILLVNIEKIPEVFCKAYPLKAAG